ncbi:MAG: MCE family protein [Gammaproteobacteria bacterium]|jgi:phospholipid/cholesterol/gamma-HCH transport system substrate-binding protein|nr:MCE family protein [Gammaproteobacteria bacterium]NBX40538.1 MCE family protein [Gammaproteobacteria bacterium]
MEREANYTAVGAFVLLVAALAVAFVYWYSDASEARSWERHEIYFEGSVSGLNVGSTVRYLGVDIGRVVALRIDRRSAARVQVIVDLDSSAPISPRTVAELSFLGVTGLLYIDLLGDAGNKPLADTVPSERYPVIRSVRSSFDVFLSGLPEVMARASDVAQRASRLLSDENIKALSGTISNLERASRGLPATMREVDVLAADLRRMARDLGAVAASLRDLSDDATPRVRNTMQRVETVAENLAATSARLDAFVAGNEGDLNAFTREGLPEATRLLRESREAAAEVRELAKTLREDPSRIVRPAGKAGVEVPR